MPDTPDTGPHPPDLSDPDDAYQEAVRRHASAVFHEARAALAAGTTLDEATLLRLVLARLLVRETDAGRLAARAAALANAVTRLTADRTGQVDDDLDHILADLDACTFTAPEGASA
jgi:hypothetical protein